MSTIRASIWNGDAGCDFEVELEGEYNALAADDAEKRVVSIYRQAFENDPLDVTVEEIDE